MANAEVAEEKLAEHLEKVIERMMQKGMLPPNLSQTDVKELAQQVAKNIKSSSERLDLSPQALNSNDGIKALVASVFCTIALEKYPELKPRFDLGRFFLDEDHTKKGDLRNDMKNDLKTLLKLSLEEANAMSDTPLSKEQIEETVELMAKVLNNEKIDEEQDKLLASMLQNLYGGIDSRKSGQMVSPQVAFVGNIAGIPLQASPSPTSTAPIASIASPDAKQDHLGTRNFIQNRFEAMGLEVAGPEVKNSYIFEPPSTTPTLKPPIGGKAGG